jgi:hypothetical protein
MPITIKRKGKKVAINTLEEMQDDDVVPFELAPSSPQQIEHALFCGALTDFSNDIRAFLRSPDEKCTVPRIMVYDNTLYLTETGLASRDGYDKDGFPKPTTIESCNLLMYYATMPALRLAGL